MNQLDQLCIVVNTIAKDWDEHRKECSERDSSNKERFEEIRGKLAVLEEIVPWARASIQKEESRKEFWEKAASIAAAQITETVTKAMVWLMTGAIIYWVGHTPFGETLIALVKH